MEFTGIFTLWVIGGIVEIALGRWVWGLFVAITGVLVLPMNFSPVTNRRL